MQQASSRTRSRSPRRFFAFSAVAILAGAGLGVGVGASGFGAQWFADATPQPTGEPAAPVPDASMPAATPRTCSIAEAVGAADALETHGLIENADTGEVLFDYRSTEATPTASVMKLITAVNAMRVLGAETRFETRVYPGAEPGSYVIVGGGDPTLKSQASSVYSGAASLDDLADQLRSHDANPARIGFDDSLFSGADALGSWRDHDRADGAIGPISALMVDAGRNNPDAHYSPRSSQPAQQVADGLASRMHAASAGRMAPAAGAQPVAVVKSPTVRELVHELLLNSDNVLGEVLARHVAIELGAGSDFAAVDAAQRQALAQLGVDASGFHGADGSGLSYDNRASAATVMQVVELIQRDEHGLGELVNYLPANQQSGTLKDRIADVPAGAIVAKTGWTDEVFGLAGYLTTQGGARLRFVVFVAAPAGSAVPTTFANRDALDAIVADVYRCGTELSGAAPGR